MKLCGVKMKKRYCLKQLLYSRFHKERVLFQQSTDMIRGILAVVHTKEICSLGNLLCFFALWCVFWDQGKEEKVNYADVDVRDRKHFIYCIKQNLEDFMCFFFFFSYFVIESSFFSNSCIENLILCCSVLEFSSFPHSGFLYVCHHGLCSTVTGLRYCGRSRETDIKLSYYYCTFGKKKITVEYFRFEINR